MRLIYTGGGVERWVDDAEERMRAFHMDSGYAYLRHVPSTPLNTLVVEDLGVTLLMNSQVTWRNAISVAERGSEIDLAGLPDRPLEETDERDRRQVAELVASVASWRGFGASTATKLMHKKHPGLIPILDNLAIFGAYMNPNWGPGQPAPYDTVKDVGRIRAALDQIHTDLNHPSNLRSWPVLESLEPGLTRVELFDSVWWMYFRDVEPVVRAGTGPGGPGQMTGVSGSGWTDEMKERQRRRMLDYYEAHPEARETMRQKQLERYRQARQPKPAEGRQAED